jgi:hypothetical protein
MVGWNAAGPGAGGGRRRRDGAGCAGAWSGALSWFGRLPGDLRFGGENGRVFVPITSMLLLSIGVSALLNLAFWFFRR